MSSTLDEETLAYVAWVKREKKRQRSDLHSSDFYHTKLRSLITDACNIAKNWRAEDPSEVRSSVIGCMNMMTVPEGIRAQCWRAEERVQCLLRAESYNSAIIRQVIDLIQRYLRTRYQTP